MKNLNNSTFLFANNSIYIEELFSKYLQNKDQVDISWHNVFAAMAEDFDLVEKFSKGATWSDKKTKVIGVLEETDKKNDNKVKENIVDTASLDSLRAYLLISSYRDRAHFLANLDPLNLEKKQTIRDIALEPNSFGFSEEDYQKNINIKNCHFLAIENITLSQLVIELNKIYNSNASLEALHILDIEEKNWLHHQFETIFHQQQITKEEKTQILQDLLEVESFENFLHLKFPGTKRFSIEGGASAISSLEKIIRDSINIGVEEIVIGMAHRGRLNVLTKVVGKPYVAMLSEFRGNSPFPLELKISSDVKYHLGSETERIIDGKKISLILTPNPSHLEAVNPVVVGQVRSKQDQKQDVEKTKIMGILIHGDAAFSGQGVVAETLMLSQLDGYKTAGTINIVINNQIGFTTNPKNAHLSRYPTEFAKIVQAPIFHVNGNDPEAVNKVSQIAVQYRNKFKKDVVIDIVCYRLYGHNEGDEPLFTQPIMYNKIALLKTTSEIYFNKLLAENVITKEQYQQKINDFRKILDDALLQEKDYQPKNDNKQGKLADLVGDLIDYEKEQITGIAVDEIRHLGKSLTSFPSGFNINAKIKKQLETKNKTIESGENIDWGAAEALAFASLLTEGYDIRLSGQDVERGTFSHRHCVLVDQLNESHYIALNNISVKQGTFQAVNSSLSEFAVLGFEYGYSKANENCLTIWEGQFGDFANGAQIIIDQFISSAQTKWLSLNSLVMLLPHGFEGQGPEHSSARLERFLQLSAENNMIVANCSTPASYFHILRRQLIAKYRKPLIIMTPKSLLRHKLAVSKIYDFATGHGFEAIIANVQTDVNDDKIRKLLICSGKLYYDLYEQREKSQINDIAIIRMEQFYPFPTKALQKELARYKNAQVYWVQEEPKNMGGWFFVNNRIEKILIQLDHIAKKPIYIGREASASPAVGSLKIHNQQQSAIVNQAIS